MFLGGNAVEYFVEFIGNCLYFSYFIISGQLFLGFQRRHKKFEWLYFGVVAIMATIGWLQVDIWGQLIIHILSIVSILLVYFKEKIWAVIAFYIGAAVMLSMLGAIFKMSVKEGLKIFTFSAGENLVKMLAQILLLAYIILIGKHFKLKYSTGLRNIGVGYLLLMIAVIFFDGAIVISLGNFIEDALQIQKITLFRVLYMGLVIGILAQLVLLVNALLTRNIYRENEQLAEKYLEDQKAHYLYLEKREEETKKFRHDIKNHLLILSRYLELNDYEEAGKYLGVLNEKVDALGNHIHVNNGVADAILNKFYAEAKEYGIELKVTGHFPMQCYVSAFDICTILSNLLSNAVEAERESGKNSIELEVRHKDSEMFIVIQNNYSHELKYENEFFQTSKLDVSEHGYGLKNVYECVKNNKGQMDIATDNNCFKVMISMKNEKKEHI